MDVNGDAGQGEGGGRQGDGHGEGHAEGVMVGRGGEESGSSSEERVGGQRCSHRDTESDGDSFVEVENEGSVGRSETVT